MIETERVYIVAHCWDGEALILLQHLPEGGYGLPSMRVQNGTTAQQCARALAFHVNARPCMLPLARIYRDGEVLSFYSCQFLDSPMVLDEGYAFRSRKDLESWPDSSPVRVLLTHLGGGNIPYSWPEALPA